MKNNISGFRRQRPFVNRRQGMSGIRCLLLPIIIVLFGFMANTAFAWDNEVVHPRITQAVINYVSGNLNIQEIDNHGDFNKDVDSQCFSIDEGSVKEDHAVTAIESWQQE